MRKRYYYLLLIAILGIQASGTVAQEAAPALAYMQSIGGEFKKIQQDTWDYTRSIAKNKSARKVENKRKELISTIKGAMGRMRKLGGYKGDATYRDSVLSFLDISKSVIEENYAKIMEMEDIAEQSYDFMEAYLLAKQTASEILQAAGERMDVEQEAFASKNNITLVKSETKLSKKLEESNQVFKNYNEVYLIFFKSYKQEAYLLDATSQGNINGMEQNRNSLVNYSEEGLNKLKEVSAYKGDNSLKTACLQMLNFYKEEATLKYGLITDFYLKKENFDKMTEVIDKKPQKDRTKEEIDAYNKSLKEYNGLIEKFNQRNKELYESRSRLLNEWNKAAEKFTSSHVG